jgi:hypothetical protein
MLAKFENGYFLEVLIDKEENAYGYTVYDEDGDYVDDNSTEYRSMEMYYPMNEIDYILEFCEPEDVDGKYELLEYETMEEYLPHEDDNGKWILERQGDEEDIRNYRTFEAAQRVMRKEYKDIYGDDNSYHMENTLEDDYAIIGDEEFYQYWKIYEEKTFDNPIEKKFDEIQKELDRADTGVSQYAFELMSTDVIRDHLYKVEQLLNELKEMI